MTSCIQDRLDSRIVKESFKRNTDGSQTLKHNWISTEKESNAFTKDRKAWGISGQRRRARLREDIGVGGLGTWVTQAKGKPFLLNKELLSPYCMLGSSALLKAAGL